MGGFHKPTVMTVIVVVIVAFIAYHLYSKRAAAKSS
jgi:hypothetical protein